MVHRQDAWCMVHVLRLPGLWAIFVSRLSAPLKGWDFLFLLSQTQKGDSFIPIFSFSVWAKQLL